MATRRWLRSSTILVAVAFVYMLVTVTVAVYEITTLPDSQGDATDFAGLALIAIAALSILFFLVALLIALLLRQGGTVKSVAAITLILAGSFVYWSSGFFAGFLPVLLLALLIGLLALYEEHGGGPPAA